jgi:hypothetical protein
MFSILLQVSVGDALASVCQIKQLLLLALTGAAPSRSAVMTVTSLLLCVAGQHMPR